MTITIITGSIQAFDTTGELLDLKRKGFFNQWYFTKRGWKKKETMHGKRLEQSALFNMVQTTGSGKTLLAALLLWKAHKGGMKTAANMKLNFIDTEVKSFNEFMALAECAVLLDDIKHVIPDFHCSAADLSVEFSNSSRKKKDKLLITAQRLVNYVPPSIRDIADTIYVPWIRCFDATTKAPDWNPMEKRYLPLEICAIKFSGGMDFIGVERYNLTGKTGKQIINSFQTLEISKGLT